MVRVYVSGAVRNPDVYFLPPGSLVRDAVAAAGGATIEADLEQINLARELRDQEHIHVPVQGQTSSVPTSLPAASQKTTNAGSEELQPGQLNLNTATAQELERLPGIGPTYAQRIVEYRAEHGPFQAIEDVMKVRGIGQSTFDKIRRYITVE